MANFLASMLGATPMPRPKRPPSRITSKHILADMQAEVGPEDGDGTAYPNFDAMLATRNSDEARDTMRRIAYLLRARLEMSQFDLVVALKVGDNFLRKLVRTLIEQGWITQETRKGCRHKTHYVITEAGAKVFAEVRQ